MDVLRELLLGHQLAPHTVLAVAGLAVALAVVLYVLVDAASYRGIPELTVPLKDGAYVRATLQRRSAVLALTMDC